MIAISRTGRLLRRLVRAACRRPNLTALVSLALAALALVYTFGALTFRTATRDLLPPGQRYATLLTEYLRDFGELDDITVVVEGRTLEESKAYASRLVREIRRGPVTFERGADRGPHPLSLGGALPAGPPGGGRRRLLHPRRQEPAVRLGGATRRQEGELHQRPG